MQVSASTLQQLALEYQALGLPAIPAYRGRPLVLWQPYQHRLPEPEEVEAWPWQKADGLAIICGHQAPGGGFWWCLDIEHQHRAEAERWLDATHPGWRQGLIGQSQRNGLHVYCLSRQPVRTTRHRWGDIKGSGSLVYAPPSKAYKPDAVGDYQWLSYQPEEALQLEPADLPWPSDNGHQQGSLGREPLREVLRRTIPKGSRNTTLTRLAGLLRGQLDLPPDEVLTILRVLNDSHCEEPLDDVELQAIARSSSKWPANPVLLVNGNGHRQSPVTTLNDSDGDDDPVAIDVSTLPEPPRRGWLVPDLLPEGTVSCWFGDDGTGKSVLALALAICVASGKPFLDRPVQQGSVLFIDTEFDQDEFIRRAYQLARGMGFAAPPAGVLYYRTRFSLTTPGGQRDIVRLVERYQPTLLIIDSITLGAFSDDLKEASATTSLLEFLQRLPTTVLTLDHVPKPPPGASLAYARPWGSFAKRAKTRHAVLVSQAEAGGIVLRVTKSNLAKVGAMVGADITWTDDAIRVTAVPLDDDALAGIEHHLPALEQVYRTLCQHEAMTPQELAEETGLAVGTVRNKLTALRHQGRAEPLGDGRWRGIGPATLVVQGDSHLGVITVTGYKASDSDYDPGSSENPHQNCKKALHTPVDHTSGSGDEPENPHQNCEKALHACVVCGQAILQVSGQVTRYCSTACRVKAYRQRQSAADTPGRVEPEPLAVEWTTLTLTPFTSVNVNEPRHQQSAPGQVTPGSLATETNGHPPDPGTCLDCHQPITAEGFQYRCPACLKARYDRLGREYPEKLVRWLQTHDQKEGRR